MLGFFWHPRGVFRAGVDERRWEGVIESLEQRLLLQGGSGQSPGGGISAAGAGTRTLMFVVGKGASGNSPKYVNVLDPDSGGAVLASTELRDETGARFNTQPLGVAYYDSPGCLYVSFDDASLYAYRFNYPFDNPKFSFKMNLGQAANRIDVSGQGLAYTTAGSGTIHFREMQFPLGPFGCSQFPGAPQTLDASRPSVAPAAGYNFSGVSLWQLNSLVPNFISESVDGVKTVYHPYLYQPGAPGAPIYQVTSPNIGSMSVFRDDREDMPSDRSPLYREAPFKFGTPDALDTIAQPAKARVVNTSASGTNSVMQTGMENQSYVRVGNKIVKLREIKAYDAYEAPTGEQLGQVGCPWKPGTRTEGEVQPAWGTIFRQRWWACDGQAVATLHTLERQSFNATFKSGVTATAPYNVFYDNVEAYGWFDNDPGAEQPPFSARLSTNETLDNGTTGWKSIQATDGKIKLQINEPGSALELGRNFWSQAVMKDWGAVMASDAGSSALWLHGLNYQKLGEFTLTASISSPEDIDVSLVSIPGPRLTGKIYVDLTRPAGTKKRQPGLYAGQLPLRHVNVRLEDGSGAIAETFTDDDGNYEFTLPAAGNYRLRVTLYDKEELVRVYDDSTDAANIAFARTAEFAADDGTVKDFKIQIAADSSPTYTPNLDGANPGNSNAAHFGNLAYTYQNMKAAMTFAETLNVQKREDVHVYPAGATSMNYTCSTHVVQIPPGRAPANAEARPFADWHESGHHIMCASPVAGVDNLPPSGDAGNHRGIANSTSSDSWSEGFASYMAALVQEAGGDPRPQQLEIRGGTLDLSSDGALLDDPRKVGFNPTYGSLAEELAIASLMWDLDRRIGTAAVWSVLSANTPNMVTFKAAYDGFKTFETGDAGALAGLSCSFPTGATKAGLDCLFINRGFYRDANDNGEYDTGEKVGVTRWTRPAAVERGELPDIPGASAKLNVVDSVTGAALGGIELEMRTEYDGALASNNSTSTITLGGPGPFTLPVLVPGVPSRLVLIAHKAGYNDSAPVVITSDFFHDAINPFRAGGVNALLLTQTMTLVKQASLAGRAFNDLNGNGVYEPGSGETLLAGRTVYLDTNGDGRFGGSTSKSSTDVPKAILDFTTSTSAINFGGLSGTIGDVDVTVSLTHTFDSDLTLTLVGPGGQRVALASGVGGDGDDFINTVFDDQAAGGIGSGTAPFTGHFRPQSPLAGLAGIDPNGTWALEVRDGGNGDTGTLQGWSLAFQLAEPNVTTDGQGQYAFTPLTPGAYTVRTVLPASWVLTGAAAPSGGYAVNLAAGQQVTGLDFGQRDVAPSVIAARLLSGSKPHRLRLIFSEDVLATLQSGDLTIRNASTNAQITPTSFDYNADTRTGIWTFAAALPEAAYRATIVAADVKDPTNHSFDGNGDGTGGDDFVFNFRFLIGDADADGKITTDDYFAIDLGFANHLAGFDHGDFDYNGTINGEDYFLIDSRFVSGVPAASGGPRPLGAVPGPALFPDASLAPDVLGSDDDDLLGTVTPACLC